MSVAQNKRTRPEPKRPRQARTRLKDVELEHRLAEELGRYTGEWVAVGGHEVIGHAKTPEMLERQLASRKPPRPYRTFRVTAGVGATLL